MKTRTNKTKENVPKQNPKDSPEKNVEKKLTKTLDHSIKEKVNPTNRVELRAVGNIIDEKRYSISPKSVKIRTNKNVEKTTRTKAEEFS